MFTPIPLSCAKIDKFSGLNGNSLLGFLGAVASASTDDILGAVVSFDGVLGAVGSSDVFLVAVGSSDGVLCVVGSSDGVLVVFVFVLGEISSDDDSCFNVPKDFLNLFFIILGAGDKPSSSLALVILPYKSSPVGRPLRLFKLLRLFCIFPNSI